MLRTRYLPAGLLALILVTAACSSGASATPSASAAASSAAAASSEAAETAAATASSGAPSGTLLADLIPGDLDGATPQVIDAGDNPMMAQALASAGIDATDFEYLIATYGTGTDAVSLSAMRVTGVDESTLQTLAGQMSGATTGGQLEATTVAGKSVLRLSGSATPGTGYIYIVDGAVFTVVGASEDLVTQLLAELP